ncbi:hypothetical protein [Lysobacter gummosus]|uniref:hypothetical protein n=1 Tax=Lysobacter gummosus TaxID=262324 RepID=UPI003644C654
MQRAGLITMCDGGLGGPSAGRSTPPRPALAGLLSGIAQHGLHEMVRHPSPPSSSHCTRTPA